MNLLLHIVGVIAAVCVIIGWFMFFMWVASKIDPKSFQGPGQVQPLKTSTPEREQNDPPPPKTLPSNSHPDNIAAMVPYQTIINP